MTYRYALLKFNRTYRFVGYSVEIASAARIINRQNPVLTLAPAEWNHAQSIHGLRDPYRYRKLSLWQRKLPQNFTGRLYEMNFRFFENNIYLYLTASQHTLTRVLRG